MWKKRIFLFLLIGLNIFITGCNDDDDDNSSSTTPASGSSSNTTTQPNTGQQTSTDSSTDKTQQTVKEHLATSLHGTTRGMMYTYAKENNGFEQFTGIPYAQLGCKEGCHVEPIAAGDCQVCHETAGDEPKNDACLVCHRRQKAEQGINPDHHLTIGMKCADCHSSVQVHGDGTAYNSMHENPTKVDCQQSGCHETLTSKSMHTQHKEDLDCAACHVSSVPTCYNCHIPSTPQDFVKSIGNWKFLVKRTSDQMITAGNFQSLTTPQGNSAYTIAPYFAHTIKKDSGMTCSTCHDSEALQEYKSTGRMTLTTWNEADKTLQNMSGVIPVPLDWQTAFKMDFLIRDSNKEWTKQGDVPDAARIIYAEPIDVANIPKF